MAYALELMRRLYFRLIVPDGPLRRFRLAEDFGEERKAREAGALGRVAGMAMAWCGLSAGCWLLAQGHFLPNVSFEPMMAFSDEAASQQRFAVAFPAQHGFSDLPRTNNRTDQRLEAGRTQRTSTLAVPSTERSSDPVRLGPGTDTPLPAIPRDLPKVSYTVSVLHQGGELGGGGTPGLESAIALAPDEQRPALDEQLRTPEREDRELTPVASDAPSFVPNVRARSAASSSTVASRAVSTQRESSLTQEQETDPFAGDFVPVRPLFALPRGEKAKAAPEGPTVVKPSLTEKHDPSGTHVLNTGGGCQAAFDASNQVVQVGKSVVGTDATSEDYGAVLSRINVGRCHPTSPLSVQVCVAVSERRAVGITVTTSPSNVGVAGCIARQIAGLRFPSSTGADLVRTRIDVE